MVGTAGPYRQFFDEVSRELVSPESPLFIPCPNRGESKDDDTTTYVIRPSATSSGRIYKYNMHVYNIHNIIYMSI